MATLFYAQAFCSCGWEGKKYTAAVDDNEAKWVTIKKASQDTKNHECLRPFRQQGTKTGTE